MSRRVNSTAENLSDEDFKRNETVKDSFAKSVRLVAIRIGRCY